MAFGMLSSGRKKLEQTVHYSEWRILLQQITQKIVASVWKMWRILRPSRNTMSILKYGESIEFLWLHEIILKKIFNNIDNIEKKNWKGLYNWKTTTTKKNTKCQELWRSLLRYCTVLIVGQWKHQLFFLALTFIKDFISSWFPLSIY